MVLAERLSDLNLTVSSVGTHALVGREMPIENQRIARSMGVTGSVNHQAQQMTDADLNSASVIFAMTRRHRQKIAEAVPKVSTKTFTLREAGLISQHILRRSPRNLSKMGNRQSFHSVLRLMIEARGTLTNPPEPEDLDVVDPFGQAKQVYEQSALEIAEAIEPLVTLFKSVD